jgi:YVTN family beta-propeller protein
MTALATAGWPSGPDARILHQRTTTGSEDRCASHGRVDLRALPPRRIGVIGSTKMTGRRWALGACVVIGVALGAARAGAQKTQLLFVENSRGGDVSVIDDATLAVIGTIPVGLSPDDIVPSPNGDVLYLARIVRRDDGRPAGTGEVAAIDPATRRILWRASFRGTPNHLAVSPDGQRVYVTIVSGSWVDVIDPAKRAVVDSVEVGTGPHDIEVSRDGKRVYVGLIRGTDVTVFDAATRQVLRKIPFGENVRPIALSHDESRLYVQLSRFHGFVVVDPRSGTIVRRVAMPVPAGSTLPSSMPNDVNHGLRITRDGRYLIANGSLLDFVAIYSLPDLALVATVPVGHDPNWVTLSPDGKRCYVSNRGSDEVSVIDLASRKEVGRIKVGKYPQRMAAVFVNGDGGGAR